MCAFVCSLRSLLLCANVVAGSTAVVFEAAEVVHKRILQTAKNGNSRLIKSWSTLRQGCCEKGITLAGVRQRNIVSASPVATAAKIRMPIRTQHLLINNIFPLHKLIRLRCNRLKPADWSSWNCRSADLLARAEDVDGAQGLRAGEPPESCLVVLLCYTMLLHQGDQVP